MNSAVLNLGALRRASQMQRHFPDHFVANEPSSRGSQASSDRLQPKTLGQVVKCARRIGKKARAHAGTKPRLRMPELLPLRAWLARGLAMELQFVLSADKLHVSARLVQQSRQIQCGSSAADHDNASPSERLNLAMTSAVGKKFRRQVRQVLRNMFKVSNPNREDNPAGLECLSIL